MCADEVGASLVFEDRHHNLSGLGGLEALVVVPFLRVPVAVRLTDLRDLSLSALAVVEPEDPASRTRGQPCLSSINVLMPCQTFSALAESSTKGTKKCGPLVTVS